MTTEYSLQYGRGIKSIAEQIKSHPGPVTREDIAEAKKLSEDFFSHYPQAKAWMEGNYKKAREQGYVEDLWGRRRRLPDASLPKYQFELLKSTVSSNPLLGTSNKVSEPSKEQVSRYTVKLDGARSKEARDIIIKEAEREGLRIHCNSGYIAQAERQSINAPIQGAAATMTKLALRDLFNDEDLKRMGFRLLLPVHDEIIGEAPVWYLDKVTSKVEDIMIHAGEPECKVPMKCDCVAFDYWYQDQAEAHIHDDYLELINKGFSQEEAFEELKKEEYSEFSDEAITKVINEISTSKVSR